MKAVILAGGRGKRLGDIGVNKCMLTVQRKPLIEYSLNCILQTDIREIIVVVGFKAEEIINAYGNTYQDRSIRYVIQQQQRGLVHAIECAREAIGSDDFMLMLGDELMLNPRHKDMIKLFAEDRDIFAICGVVTVEERELISKTYSIIESDGNRIYRLIEKPAKPMNDIMGTGNCIFRNEILLYIEHTPINQKRGEKELPDMIQCAIDEGNLVRSFVICDRYFNVNSEQEFKAASSCFAHL